MNRELAARLHATIAAGLALLDDCTASKGAEAYPRLHQDGRLIPAGTRIRWQGTLWRASADLWDTPENTPDRAQTLWQALAYREGYRVIPQVIPAEQRFARGECGWWQGALWRSLLEGNVHTPAAYPAGWEEVQP